MPKHSEQATLPHSPEQVFAVVADVERYPDFLPWCRGARVWRGVDEAVFEAELAIGFGVFYERFRSRVHLRPCESITVSYLRGPFARLVNRWRFSPTADGCLVDFFIDYECAPGLLRIALNSAFSKAVREITAAFKSRASALYPQPGRLKETC